MLSDEPGIEIVGEAANGRQALSMCSCSRPDLILMDVRMPVMDGLTSMRKCKTLEVRFRALLSQDETRQLEVVRV